MRTTLLITLLTASASIYSQVGIGTTSPTVELDVESSAATTSIDINNTAADGDPAINFQLSGTTTFSVGIDNGDSDKLKIGTTDIGTSTRLTIDATGLVGIGTSSPIANLEIEDAGIPAVNEVILKITADDSSPYGLVIGNDTYSTTDNEGMTFYVSDAGDALIEAKGGGNLSLGYNGVNGDDIYITSTEVIINDDSGSTLDFRVESDNDDYLFFVDASADRIGVSTSTPRSILDIASTDPTVYINAYDDSNYPYIGLLDADASETAVDLWDWLGGIDFWGYDGSAYRQAAGIWSQVEATPGASDMPGGLVFYTTPDGSATLAQRFRIGQNGYVGVGNITPSYFLDIYGDESGNFVGSFMNDGNNANRYGIAIQAGADDGSGTTYYVSAYDGDGTSIGYIENNSGTFQLVDVSDRGTKTNIKNTEVHGLSVVDNLRVVDFTRIDHKTNPKVQHGFIAQEVSKVYPYMVSETPDGKLGVAKEQLIPVLVKATQEQQDEIEDLQDQINVLMELNRQMIALLSPEQAESLRGRLERKSETKVEAEQKQIEEYARYAEQQPEMQGTMNVELKEHKLVEQTVPVKVIPAGQ